MIMRFLLAVITLPVLAACSSWMGEEEKPPLQGTRLSVMQLQKKLEPDTGAAGQAFAAPTAWKNEFWPQAGGYPGHAMAHLALNTGDLKRLWSADIGAGASAAHPLTAQPVTGDGRIFALDTDQDVSAFDATTGRRAWRVNISAQDEDETAIGGGLAFAGGALYATNSDAEIVALKPDDGAEFWRVRLPSPSRAAPTVLDGRVYVVTLDNRLLALNAADGAQLWSYRGVSEGAGLLGAASPAANRDVVVAAFSSGDLIAFRVENGSVAWTDNLAPPLRLGGAGALSDIRALPVLDNGAVIAVSYAGRLVAIDERTGARIWQRDISGQETPLVAGSYIFVLSADHQLIALARDNGAIRWVTQLPRFRDEDERTGALVWRGPLYAGDRLMVAGDEGRVLNIDPATGAVQSEWDAGGSAAVPMLVAAEILYTLDQSGTLSAWK